MRTSGQGRYEITYIAIEIEDRPGAALYHWRISKCMSYKGDFNQNAQLRSQKGTLVPTLPRETHSERANLKHVEADFVLMRER